MSKNTLLNYFSKSPSVGSKESPKTPTSNKKTKKSPHSAGKKENETPVKRANGFAKKKEKDSPG